MMMSDPPQRLALDGLDWHFKNWQRYMHGGGVHIGCEGQGGFAGNYDLAREQEKADYYCFEVMDTVINDLTLVEQCAIQRWLLSAVWRFPRENYGDVLARAQKKVEAGLRARRHVCGYQV